MNPDILKAFSPSSQRVLRTLAGSPEDAVSFHQRLTILRAGLRIGLEVLERNLEERGKGGDKQATAALVASSTATLGVCSAIECCMSVLENLHPGLGKMNTSAEPPKGLPGVNGMDRLRLMDLD